MELGEKLQQLRKSRNLTQDELAEILFVSRTAISKWESGRGYPSIDSLKEISQYFSVTIDELLSGEKLLTIANKENKANIRKMCDMLLGIVDLFTVTLIVLPLYPKAMNGFVHSVNLFVYTKEASFSGMLYWILFLCLMATGMAKSLFTQLAVERGQKLVTVASFGLSVVTVLFLAIRGETYAVALAFLLLVVKGILLLKHTKNL